MTCPVCKTNKSKTLYTINGHQIVKCKTCSHSFTQILTSEDSVDQIYSDNYFFGGEDGYPDYTKERDMLITRGEQYADIVGKYIKPGSLFDIGAAAGFLIKGFENKGWKVSGIEPNRSMVNYGKRELGLNLKLGTLESTNLDIKADIVTLVQVIAHLYDLNRSMDVINSILKIGGYVLIETWNKDSVTARMLGRNWHEYSPPSTINYFSKKTLDFLMRRYGFLRIAIGKPRKKIHSTHAKSLLKYKLKTNNSLRWMIGIEKLFPSNKYLSYPAEDLFWALYKKIK